MNGSIINHLYETTLGRTHVFAGLAETVTAALDELQLAVAGAANTNDIFRRYPGEPYDLPSGETSIPVHYHNSRLIQVVACVGWEHLNEYAGQFGLHAVRYGNKGLVVLMMAKHKNSSLGEYSEYLYSFHASPRERRNLGALPSIAALSSFNPLGFDDEDGLLVAEVAVTAQNVTYPDAREVGRLVYGLNKRIGDIEIGRGDVVVTTPNGKLSLTAKACGPRMPVAIGTRCFTTGTTDQDSTWFPFEIRSWLRASRITDLKIEPGDDEDGLLELLRQGRVLGGLSGIKAQAILGKPVLRA